jgi:UDP-glucose 4-epimerase
MMKILVTGGAGFIGSNVVDGYIEAGHEVVVVDNLFTGRKENVNPSAKFYEIDVRADELDEIFQTEKPEIVNHHAAQMSVPASVEDPKFDADVNIMGFLNLLECSVKYNVRKVIFISSGGAIYGEASVYPTPETYPPYPISPYAITKFVSEHYLNFYRLQHGLDFTVLRYANVYGPRQIPHGEAGVVAIFMDMLKRGDLPIIYHYENEPEGMARDYCHVADIFRANLLSLEKGSGEVFNIGTGTGTSTMELYRLTLKIMREAGYANDSVFDSPRKGPARAGDLRRSCLDCGKAKVNLGWCSELKLDAGMKSTVEWFFSEKRPA